MSKLRIRLGGKTKGTKSPAHPKTRMKRLRSKKSMIANGKKKKSSKC